MDTIETLIPDNMGNHLVVVLYFYDDGDKLNSFKIPEDFAAQIDIADININKLDLDEPLGIASFHIMCEWLMEQFLMFPNAIFSFICATDPIVMRHCGLRPEEYRWRLFEYLYQRNKCKLDTLGIHSQDVIIGPEGYQTYAKVFYRDKHAPIIHIVVSHLKSKYS